MDFSGKRIAVLGMGRSGIGVAHAAAKRGALVTLFDERFIDTPEKMEAQEALQGHGVEVVPGWHGRFEDPEFDLLVTSPGFARNHPAHQDALHSGIEIWSEVEFAYRIALCPIVAITGTNGKSTTTVMTWIMARSGCPGALLCGNISGSGYDELTFTEAADRAGAAGLLIAEVSSFQLEWVHELRPRVACITNITPDHFDRHPDFADYRGTKLRLFANMGKGDTVVRAAHAAGLDELKLSNGVNFVQVGDEQSTTWKPGVVILQGHEYAANELNLVGPHNLVNAATAYELAKAALGSTFIHEKAVEALRSFEGLEHRAEVIGQFRGVTVINASMTTNPAALIATASGSAQKLHILAGGVTKELDFGPALAFFRESDHEITLFGPEIPGRLQVLWGGEFPRFSTMEEAFEAAMERAMDGETVILAPGCASAPPHTNFRERGLAFKRYVKQWLENRQDESSGTKL